MTKKQILIKHIYFLNSMNKKYLIIILAAFAFASIISHLYNNFFFESMIIGKYANKNFKYRAIAEVPHIPDTLYLDLNNKYISKYWGKGTWSITHSIEGTYIRLESYEKEFGPSISTYFSRIWYGKPKIIMFMDLNHYYEKID
jgi:hypothetical protein